MAPGDLPSPPTARALARRHPTPGFFFERPAFAILLRSRHAARGARAPRQASRARRRWRCAHRAHRRDRGVSRPARPRGPFVARAHAPHARHVRPAGPRVRVPHLRNALVHERGDRARGPRFGRAASRAGTGARRRGAHAGPGLLCRAMGIDKRLHGHDLVSRYFFIADPRMTRRCASSAGRASGWTTPVTGRGACFASTSAATGTSRVPEARSGACGRSTTSARR